MCQFEKENQEMNGEEVLLPENLEVHVQEQTKEKTPFEISSCDACFSHGVYVKPGYDSWGTHVVDTCFYGCDDPRNIPVKEKQNIEVLTVERTAHADFYESTWKVRALINDVPEIFALTRFNSESEERLRIALSECLNRDDILRLNQFILHN